MKKILLVYYHPVIFDLALTFEAMGHSVFVAVNQNIKDNYGTGFDIIKTNKEKYKNHFDVMPLSLALAQVKKFDLVGLDGVFSADELMIDACSKQNVPYFCVQGYPHNLDEPSQNILSFSWFMPQIQYKQAYPHEPHIKEIDWKNIAEKNKSEGKNIHVFYPNCWEWKAKIASYLAEDNKNSLIFKERTGEFVSAIHRFEECNKWSYEVFKILNEYIEIVNLEGKSKDEVFEAMLNSSALVHLKHGDCPGMAVLEAMLVGCVPVVMKSFVLASFNQEVIIDRHSGIICETQAEMVEELMSFDFDDRLELCSSTISHANMLTSFDRQKYGLQRFLERCK